MRSPRGTPPTFDALRRYCPHRPWPVQQAFLDLGCREAFYGGAAAGGKSDALLMAALQYANVPGYAALILRRDLPRLRLAGGLLERAHAWLSRTGAVWSERERRWSFPTAGAPASLAFGFLRRPRDAQRYLSSEFQFIAFDELTEFGEEEYLFLFSRLRRRRGVRAPLRMRGASNPGGLGHAWVKARFVSPEAEAFLRGAAEGERERGEPRAPEVFWRGTAAFVPARLADNPAVDPEEYRASLLRLPPLLRERMLHGDWSVQAAGLIRAEWLRSYEEREGRLELRDAGGSLLAAVEPDACRRFVTIDPAGTSADRAREERGRPASWSVAQVWDQPRGDAGRFLLLRDVHARWRPAALLIEDEKLGRAVLDVLGRELPLCAVSPGGQDKVARAAALLTKLERGEVYLPRAAAWRTELEAEWLAWTGLPEQPSDQIDAAAYAAREAQRQPSGPLRVAPVRWSG